MPQVRIQKPKAILFDINGTTANNSFCDRYLGLYIRKNVRGFLSVFWDHEQIQRDIRMMRIEVATNDQLPQVAPEGSEKAVLVDSVVRVVADALDKEIDLLSLAQLRFHMWFDGFEKEVLRTHIYSDVAIQMKRWRCDYDIKLFVTSHGWAEANKIFLQRTNQGDMTLLIDGYYDTAQGDWNKPESYQKVLENINLQGSQVVMFTKSGSMAKAAAQNGIIPILVMTHKKMYDALGPEEKQFAIIRTMNEVEFEDLEA